MQTAPTRWNSLWAAHDSRLEMRFTLDNVAYTNEHIAAGGVSVTHYLYDSYSIGNACAGKLNVNLLDPQTIARGIREATLECRMASADGSTVSGWLQQGTWYLNSVEYASDGTAQLELLDGLALCDVYLYDKGVVPSSASWPKTATAAVQAVCDKVGIPRPSSYTGFSSVQVPAPDGLTCREILESIASLAGGNFTMAKNGRLLFVPLGGTGGTASCEISCTDYRRTSDARTVTGLKLVGFDDEYSYGSDAFEVSGNCAWADEQVGNSAYYAVRGLQYQGFSASGCFVSPLVELSDTVSVAGTNVTMLADDLVLTYGQGMWGSVAAPMRDEVEQRIKNVGSSQKLNRMARMISGTSSEVDYMSTAEYVSELLERVNAQANATGGYTYITEGQGIRTYDHAVSDPLVGAEATAVVEVKGGTVRIANSRYTGSDTIPEGSSVGDWKWLTVFTSGHIAAELVTAVNIVAGFIGSPSGNYWNLDTGELRMAATATIGGQTVQQIANSAASGVDSGLNQAEILRRLTGGYTTEGLYISNGHLYANASVLKTGILTDGQGKNYWNLNTGEFSLMQDIGTRNFLDGTAKWAGWVKKGGWTFSGANAVCAAKNSVANWNDRIMSPLKKLKYSEVRGYKCTLSFEGVSGSAWGTKGELNQLVVTFGLLNSSNVRVAHFNRTFAFTTSWVRKKVTVDLIDSSFSYDSGQSGSLDDLFLVMQIYNRSKHKLTLRKFKLERGTQATDWCISWDDASLDAQEKANSALQKAYAKDAELDNALNQAGIFNRLFPLINGSRPHGLRLVNGRAYLNASYINTGTLNGKYIKAGVISDNLANPNNTWNLGTGELVTKNAKMSDANVTGRFSCGGALKVVLNGGQLIGYRKVGGTDKRQCYIDASAVSRNLDTNRDEYGMQMQANQIIRISTPHLAIQNSSNAGETATFGWTGTKKWNVISSIRDNGDGSITWWTTEHGIRCINGIVTSVW